jgi:uncharacterized protein (DUF4415 family)
VADRWLVFGPDRAINTLEVVVLITSDGTQLAISRDAHAPDLRTAATTMSKPTHGNAKSGRAITDADVQRLADEAERGYDADALIARRGKRGRPALGSAPASVESVRLDPELHDQLTERAKADGTTPSAVIRQALRDYLHAA